MQNVSLKNFQEDAADDISRHKQTTFSDADFLGALRVNLFSEQPFSADKQRGSPLFQLQT